jgi:hypothetical protein
MVQPSVRKHQLTAGCGGGKPPFIPITRGVSSCMPAGIGRGIQYGCTAKSFSNEVGGVKNIGSLALL